MRIAPWLMVFNLAALAVIVPMCLADCLPQPTEPAACHQEHPQPDAAATCIDCVASELVKPKTPTFLNVLTAGLVPASIAGSDALTPIGSRIEAAPAAARAFSAPPLVLRL